MVALAGPVLANIREVAAANNVPLVEAPELARAIYFNAELNQAIPAALFLAVAQLLAYVFQLRAWRSRAATSDAAGLPGAGGLPPCVTCRDAEGAEKRRARRVPGAWLTCSPRLASP